MPEGVDQFLVAGDETALPAIARLLEELPDTANGQVFIEVAEEEHRCDLREIPGMAVTWLIRHGRGTGENSLLLGAVEGAAWPDGQVWAWIAGEQSVVRDLRRHLVEVRGMDKAWIDFTGYWRRQTVVALAEDAAVPDPEKNETAFSKIHEMAEILPPLALRVAADLGIADRISRGTTAVDDLVAATGTDARALRKFLRYLQALDILVPSGADGYQLSETGEVLTNEHVHDHLVADGFVTRRELAFRGLAESLRTGKASYRSVAGTDYAGLREDADYLTRQLESSTGGATFMGARLASSGIFDATRSLVIHSDGAVGLAGAILTRNTEAKAMISAMPAEAAWLRKDLPETVPDKAVRHRICVLEQARFDATPAADTILIARELANHPDADAALLLRRAASCLSEGERIIVVEPTFDITDEGPDEHAAEADLLNLTLVGSGFRTPAELDAVIEAAGLTIAETQRVGGVTVREVR
ncbi:siderophore-interacting protein, partial [uncultured Corynebacterium sp.]|uniref:siderophore-interacting protein n=1 Tax=uncultured Corynebacterium sp. TaxID=159447 RepID=UPI0025F90C4D